MPIYEYACKACGHEFETLVLGETKPECPSCQSRDLERLALPAHGPLIVHAGTEHESREEA